MDFNNSATYTGLNASLAGGINLKSQLEDFLKIEYTEGLRNEFAVMDALINSLSKDTITGKKKYKSFALGITDNIRSLGGIGASDMYNVGLGDFIKAADTVDAEFDTTKLIGVFSVTDETLMKSSTDGSLFDVLGDTLQRMQLGLKHTMNRYTYGGHAGKIGVVSSAVAFEADSSTANPGVQTGKAAIAFGSTAADIVEVYCSNSMSLLPGMGVMLKVMYYDATASAIAAKYRQGKIWQKDDSTNFDKESLIIVLDAASSADATAQEITAAQLEPIGTSTAINVELYAKQLVNGTVGAEYHGLEDIIIKSDSTVADEAIIFGVDRRVYRTLRCLKKDLNGSLLTESTLRDMADKISLVTPEGAGVNLVCAKHAIISTIEKQMYQFKTYSLDAASNGTKLGRPDVMFDTYQLKKDKYARDNNVYLMDTTKIGELLRKDFGWITSGRETILERRDGSEIYEAIMTKYADMYIDAWKAHGCFVNVADSVGTADTYARSVNIASVGSGVTFPPSAAD